MNDKIKEKLRRLLAIAMNPSANEAEASSAQAKADELMQKYGVSPEQVLQATKDDYDFYEVPSSKRDPSRLVSNPVDLLMARRIAEYTGFVLKFRHSDPCKLDMPKIVYYGLRSDLDYAMSIRDALIESLRLGWETYKNYRLGKVTRAQFKEARKAFVTGFAISINKRLHIDKPEVSNSSRELVVLKQEHANTAARAEGYIDMTFSNASVKNKGAAFAAGKRQGDKAGMHRGMGGNRLMIGKD